MSVARADIVADIRRNVGDDVADNEDDYRFSSEDVTAAMQLAVNRMFEDVPAYLYDVGIIIAAPTITSSTDPVPVTSGGRVALAHLGAYYLMLQDKEDANNLAVAGTHYANYERERRR